jgi:hypothetical protein
MATPSKQTDGVFHHNLVLEYSRERAVAKGREDPAPTANCARGGSTLV